MLGGAEEEPDGTVEDLVMDDEPDGVVDEPDGTVDDLVDDEPDGTVDDSVVDDEPDGTVDGAVEEDTVVELPQLFVLQHSSGRSN
ncbi:hypothetical protein PMKS-004227 [Pichia membranifaciens]|uniref:Uncharacterized protein n=1 Tax=Pichia membranifaciens TaxID=4926 RepID=A0A1Q2YMD3_9ASCO|nr:hypothetical protein PMKS-004227 [Pichia membranifaciens]